MSGRQENVKWVDGLRGIASLLVVFTHIARSFDEDLFKPTDREGLPPRILQYPFIRILFQGRIGVTIFSLVTGYVCALKPLRQIRSGNPGSAFQSVSKSAFRRVPRLLLPTTIATSIIWVFCQFGVFEMGTRINSWWMNDTSPVVIRDMSLAVKSLIYNIITTWTREWNVYDRNQWTLLPLLRGSMTVYIFIVATAHCKTRYRMMLELAMFVYYYVSHDSAFGMQMFFGVFLADLAQHPQHISWCAARKWPSRILSPFLIILGLYCASYPEQEVQWVTWSRLMGNASVYIFPADCETPRYYSGLGLILIALGVHFSNEAKAVLSNKYLLWFGKNSFAVYLLHGALMRSVLLWMYFGTKLPETVEAKDEALNICRTLKFYLWLPIWFAILYTAANLWTKYVDPWCARLTEKFVQYVFEEQPDQQSTEKRLLPQ